MVSISEARMVGLARTLGTLTNPYMEKVQENRRRWLDYLATDPPKAVTMLENLLPYKCPRCCMGHACHVLVPWTRTFHPDDEEDGMGKTHLGITVNYLGEGVIMPHDVCAMLDITSEGQLENPIELDEDRFSDDADSELVESGKVGSLVELNDCTDLTHAEIGKIIEVQFKADNFKPFRYPSTGYAQRVIDGMADL